jgi:hypothetical protein
MAGQFKLVVARGMGACHWANFEIDIPSTWHATGEEPREISDCLTKAVDDSGKDGLNV